jgi:hypothetical protein
MDDIRFSKDKNQVNRLRFYQIFNFFKKNWLKILIIIILLLLILFPNLSGNIIGEWWNNFATSFLSKISY